MCKTFIDWLLFCVKQGKKEIPGSKFLKFFFKFNSIPGNTEEAIVKGIKKGKRLEPFD